MSGTGWPESRPRPSQEPARDASPPVAPDAPVASDAPVDADPVTGAGVATDGDAGADVAGSGHSSPLPRRSWDHEADRWLVEQAVAGHGQAFEVLLRRHQDRIYGIALRMTGDATAAEDVAQDVAIQLWRVLATFTGASMFTTWLYRIVVNRALNHQRAGRVVGRDTRPLLDTEHPSTLSTEQRAMDAARLDAATAALAALPPDQRAAVVLCQIEGLSYREAATIANVSEAALRSRLERGRKALLVAMRAWT